MRSPCSSRLHNSEGQFNAILIVNEGKDDALVFRSPRIPSALQHLAGEIDLLQKLQGHTTLPVPNPIYISPSLHTLGQAFMGYRMLPGQPLWEATVQALTDEVKLDHLASQLATFLRELHRLDTNAIGLEIPVDDPRTSWASMYAEFRELLFPHMRPDARERVTSNFEAYFNDASNFDYTPVLRHTDFGGSNILWNADKNTVTAIIDWTGVTLGDPAIDVAAILHMGQPFFQRMLKTYPEMEAMLPRTHFPRSTYALQEALNGIHDHDAEAFERGIAEFR